MATIADVARLAGVSQGTVSNVLNKKNNVNSDKIRVVLEAAEKLNFTINERAKVLRKGSQNVVGFLVPDIVCPDYLELYEDLKYFFSKQGVLVELFLSSDNEKTELKMIQKAKSSMIGSMIAVTCLDSDKVRECYADFQSSIFVERFVPNLPYFGFDYAKAGSEIGAHLLNEKILNCLVVTNDTKYSKEKAFLEGFISTVGSNIQSSIISTDVEKIDPSVLNILLKNPTLNTVITSNAGLANSIAKLCNAFFKGRRIKVVTLTPSASIPVDSFLNYELNYFVLADQISQYIGKKTDLLENIIDTSGFYRINKNENKHSGNIELNMLMLEGPELDIVSGLAQTYYENTGVKINVIASGYDEIYEQLNNDQICNDFDIFRIDVAWLKDIADKVLLPIDSATIDNYLPCIGENYCCVNEKIYALPLTPSTQMLFYRKDLFENSIICRLFYEVTGYELQPPKTFEEYNRIAAFFSNNTFNEIPNILGNTVTLGNPAAVTTEFFARYFSHTNTLVDENGKIVINNEIGIKSLEELSEAARYSSREVSKWWTSSAREFANGDSAMVILFGNYAAEILQSDKRFSSNIGYAMIPGSNPICGGGCVGISRQSNHSNEAVEFIKWLTSTPASSCLADLVGASPCRKDFKIGEIIRKFPWMELYPKSFISSSNLKFHMANSRYDERKLSVLIGTTIKNSLFGVISHKDALERIQKALDCN